MYDFKNAKVTDIQFFDHSHADFENFGEDNEKEVVIQQYSANVVINNELVIQLSGNSEEAHAPYVPNSNECFFNNEKLQDSAHEDLDSDIIEAFFDEYGIENNYNFLKENNTL